MRTGGGLCLRVRIADQGSGSGLWVMQGRSCVADQGSGRSVHRVLSAMVCTG